MQVRTLLFYQEIKYKLNKCIGLDDENIQTSLQINVQKSSSASKKFSLENFIHSFGVIRHQLTTQNFHLGFLLK